MTRGNQRDKDRQRAQNRAAKNVQGGASQIQANQKALSVVCKVCKQVFMCTQKKAQLEEHSSSKSEEVAPPSRKKSVLLAEGISNRTQETEAQVYSNDSRTCRHWKRGFCQRGGSCKFLHPASVPQRTSEREVCRHWKKGFCNLGNTCSFKHPKEQTSQRTGGEETRQGLLPTPVLSMPIGVDSVQSPLPVQLPIGNIVTSQSLQAIQSLQTFGLLPSGTPTLSPYLGSNASHLFPSISTPNFLSFPPQLYGGGLIMMSPQLFAGTAGLQQMVFLPHNQLVGDQLQSAESSYFARSPGEKEESVRRAKLQQREESVHGMPSSQHRLRSRTVNLHEENTQGYMYSEFGVGSSSVPSEVEEAGLQVSSGVSV